MIWSGSFVAIGSATLLAFVATAGAGTLLVAGGAATGGTGLGGTVGDTCAIAPALKMATLDARTITSQLLCMTPPVSAPIMRSMRIAKSPSGRGARMARAVSKHRKPNGSLGSLVGSSKVRGGRALTPLRCQDK